MPVHLRLVHAEPGSRVVEASALQKGEVLAMALGEGVTAEAAEEQARQRLQLLLAQPPATASPALYAAAAPGPPTVEPEVKQPPASGSSAAQSPGHGSPGRPPAATAAEPAVLEEPVQIGPRAVVGKSRVGAGTVVGAGVVIGDGCSIGRDCFFHPNATVYGGVQLGQRVLVHANAVLGSDGFGYAREAGRWIKVPQLGTTIIEDDVEVGAGTTIDRATLGVTRIGARTKIDNLCHIAHNCTIGQDVAIAANCGIAGSTSVGDRCVIAGNVGISGHLTIGPDVRLGGGTVVLKDVTEPGDYMGHPLLEKRRFLRLLRVLRGLVPGRGDGE